MRIGARRGVRLLSPVRAPWHWVLAGVLVQAVGVGVPVVYLVGKARREGIGGHITAATVRLVWHGPAHTKAGLILLFVGAVVFAAGSVLIARPYVRRPVLLLVAIPLAGAVGMLLLGAFALLLVFAIDVGDFPDLSKTKKTDRDESRPDT